MSKKARLTDEQRDMAAKNIGLAKAFVKRQISGSSLDAAQLISAANMGLITAARKFDAGRGVKFSAYANIWMRSCCQHAIRENDQIRIPDGTRCDRVAGRGSGSREDAQAVLSMASHAIHLAADSFAAPGEQELSRVDSEVRDAIERLDSDERELINRVELKGSTIGEVSRSMGLDYDHARTILRRAKIKLRAMLADANQAQLDAA